MKAGINKIKYYTNKHFCKLIICLIGFIRCHSNDIMKLKIDKMVSRVFKNSISKVTKY